MWTMPVFSGGNTELTAEMLDTVVEYLRRQGRIIPSPEVAVDQTPDGWMIRLNNPPGMWGRLERSAADRWAWTQMELAPNGRFAPHPSGRAGSTQSQWAEEVNGLVPPAGTIVWLEPTGDATGRMAFAAPLVAAGRSSVFWAEIQSAAGGRYGYREVEISLGRFAPVPRGRTAHAGGRGTAVEAGGSTAVPVGAVVLMFDFFPVNGNSPPSDEVVFRYGAATTRWGKLSGRTTNTIYSVDLSESTVGLWTAVVTDEDSGESYTAQIPSDASTVTAQNALNKAIGEDLVRVSGVEGSDGSGGPYLVEFIERLGGSRRVTLTVDGTALSGGEEDEEEVEGEEEEEVEEGEEDEEDEEEEEPVTSGAATVSRVQAGKDDPYTDGKGAYGWYEVEFFTPEGDDIYTDDGVRPKPDGLSSDWPFGAAYEAGGETNVPVGTIVRIYPGPAVQVAGRELPDTHYLFRYQGEIGRWAMIGTAGRWLVDLGRPTAGLWVVHWDDHEKNPLAVRRNASLTVSALDTDISASFGWPQPVPTRKFVSGEWATEDVITTGFTLPLPATAEEIQAGYEERFPILVGNVTVTGGPLGTVTTAIDATDPCAPVAVRTGVPVVIALTGDLAGCHGVTPPAATVQTPTFSTGIGFGGRVFTTVTASGSRILVRYDTSLGELGEYNPPGTPFGRDLAVLSTADFGTIACRPIAPTALADGLPEVYGSTTANRVPFVIDAAGYDGDADLPTVSIASFLAYGDDGTEEGEATITADPPIPAPVIEEDDEDEEGEGDEDEEEEEEAVGAAAAHRGGGVYYATLLHRDPLQSAGDVDYLLTPALIDTRVPVVSAVEVNGRTNVPVRGVVRLWTTGKLDYAPGATEPVPERWAFQGPPTGFWATVRANNGDGEYEVTPALSAWAALRHVAAAEVSGNLSVPVGTKVWVDADADGQQFRFEEYPYDTVALVTYAGPPGVYTDQPAATGFIVLSGPSSRCVVEGDTALVAGFVYAGLRSGSVPAAAAGTTLPVYTVSLAAPVLAAAGVAGALTDASQVLGAGDKIALGGFVTWGKATTGSAGGEAIPAGGRWVAESSAGSMFVGSVSAGGNRWGYRATGDAVGHQVYGGGVWGDVISLSGGVMRVTSPPSVFGPPGPAFVAPTLPFYIATGSGASAYAVYQVTRVCLVPPTTPSPTVYYFDFTVTLTGFGNGGGGGKWQVCSVAENLFGPSLTSFWTDQAAFAHDGTVGQAGTIKIPGLRSDLDFDLTFAGGILTAVSAGAGMTPFGSGFGVTYGSLADGFGTGFPDYHGATTIGISNLGLVQSITTIP